MCQTAMLLVLTWPLCRWLSVNGYSMAKIVMTFSLTCEGGLWDVQHLPAAPWPSHQRWCCSSTKVAKQPLCPQVLTLTKGGSDESKFRWKSQHVEAFAAGKRCVHYTGVLLWSFEIKYWLNRNTYLFLQCGQCRLYSCDLWGIFFWENIPIEICIMPILRANSSKFVWSYQSSVSFDSSGQFEQLRLIWGGRIKLYALRRFRGRHGLVSEVYAVYAPYAPLGATTSFAELCPNQMWW